MPSRIHEAGHTKAFDYPVADHWGESRNVQIRGWDSNRQHISPESNARPTEPPRFPRRITQPRVLNRFRVQVRGNFHILTSQNNNKKLGGGGGVPNPPPPWIRKCYPPVPRTTTIVGPTTLRYGSRGAGGGAWGARAP